MNGTTRDKRCLSDSSTNIHDLVLSWKVSQLTTEYLKEEEASYQFAPAKEFSSEEEYKKYFRVLVLHDLKSSLVSSLEIFKRLLERSDAAANSKKKKQSSVVGLGAKSICGLLGNIQRAQFRRKYLYLDVLVFSEEPSVISEGDILIVFSGVSTGITWQTVHESPLFLVDKVFSPDRKRKAFLIRIRIPEYQTSCINFSLPTLSGSNQVSTESEPGEIHQVYIKVIGSIVTASRECLAVENLSNYALKTEILKPSQCEGLRLSLASLKSPNPKFQRVMEVVDKVSDSWKLNTSQYEAVASCVTSSTGFHLIQGPPGTGKTNTLLAILNVLHVYGYQLYYDSLIENWYQRKKDGSSTLTNRDSVSSGTMLTGLLGSLDQTLSALSKNVQKPRVMICAPSNAAVDEAMSKLLQHGFTDVNGNQYQPELVRIGANERVSEATKSLTAEGQAHDFYHQFCSDPERHCLDEELKKKWLLDWNEEYRKCRANFENCSSKEKKMESYERLEQLKRDLSRLSLVFSKDRSKDQILSELILSYVKTAQIVFCTLSGAFLLFSLSGNSIPQGTSLHSKNPRNSRFCFETVIIDEAAQATEPSCLIPFLFQVKRCVLIGDPQQLPATVFSCGDLGTAYGQSLMERFCRLGRHVMVLNTQYRMHPEISLFPNQYFYRGLLQDDISVCNNNRAHKCHADPLKPLLGPYAVIDISDGKECRSSWSGSFYNEIEADVVARIYQYFQRKYLRQGTTNNEENTLWEKKVGIVTPYRRQLLALKQAFEKNHLSLHDVEIDSVDAFQGREKDWIILSCVRCSFERGIGFVRDIRRMNVAITRAKYSLLIVGNMKALAHHSMDWAALVENAKQRGCLLHGTATIERLSLALQRLAPQKIIAKKERKIPSSKRKRLSPVENFRNRS
ncbi:hypothetical protein GAYE_SCF51G6039 [Galdieria yellowstonensis]|uniref:Uncharacterized protein n=1 Tax=Galdieria yellowstonensis TaxID=3028027 RepID=A0AAV9IL34_9RHOD|nr:hypothetical protein GAYE_SCF51G6039 [Galdieria yellowstonensis]